MSQQQPSSSFNRSRKGFSLIELVIVVVIIGIIAAIAIPKMSKGAAGAGDSALQGNLAVLRNAIELYNSEHGKFPSGSAMFVSRIRGMKRFDEVEHLVAAIGDDVERARIALGLDS